MQKNRGHIISIKPRLCLVHLLDEDALAGAFRGVVNYTAACLFANCASWNKRVAFTCLQSSGSSVFISCAPAEVTLQRQGGVNE